MPKAMKRLHWRLSLRKQYWTPVSYPNYYIHEKKSDIIVANFAAFEIDDEVLGNMREYALANSLYWVGLSSIKYLRR